MSLGRVRKFIDPNGVVTTYAYNDPLDRLTDVVEAETKAAERRHRFSYNDAQRKVTAQSDKENKGDYSIQTVVSYDTLGRAVRREQADDSNQTILVDTEFDGLGRAKRVTNPYRSGDSIHWATTNYDGLGRVTDVTTPDGATSSTQYMANRVRQTDPASKWRESTSDSLGRIVSVKEGNSNITNYTYNAMGKLLTVTQDTQTRQFTYNDVGWLLSATNPESGTITYGHDAVGNVTSREMGGSTTTYAYDAIHRLTSTTYSGASTQNVAHTYHSVAPYIGFLASVGNSISTTSYPSYDGKGRVLRSVQAIEGSGTGGGPASFEFDYAYDLVGNLTEMKLPSGRRVATDWSITGHTKSVSGQLGQAAPVPYFTNAKYAAHGGLTEAQLGNQLWERWSYLPDRLLPWKVQVGTESSASSASELQFSYCVGAWGSSCATNNGNLTGQKIQPLHVTQSYTYDAVNRLKTASESFIDSTTSWNEGYDYDRYGNLWWSSSSGSLGTRNVMMPESADWYRSGNNRLLPPSNDPTATVEALHYDAAGNLKKYGLLDLEYDRENRLAKSTGSGVTEYKYDGLGRRVVKDHTAGAKTYYVYDAFGQLSAEYATGSSSSMQGTQYLSADHLGSTRLVTNASGEVVSRHDYLPFGEELPNTVGGRQSVAGYTWNPDITQRFTGKERDAETGLDYFGARYLGAGMGRFTGADPINVTPARMLDPQRFNLYLYGRNNPLKFIDADGRDVHLANDSEEYRLKAFHSITKNLTAQEQRNIGYRKNAGGKYELYVKNPGKIDKEKAFEGYQQLSDRIANDSLQLNVTLVPIGGSVSDPDGNILSHSVLAGAGGSGGVTYYQPGTGLADIFVAEGGKPTGVAGLTASGRDVGIAFPEYIITAHELFGETIKLTPGNTYLQQDVVADSVSAVELENKIRSFHGLPQRSGKDHANYPTVQTVTVTP